MVAKPKEVYFVSGLDAPALYTGYLVIESQERGIEVESEKTTDNLKVAGSNPEILNNRQLKAQNNATDPGAVHRRQQKPAVAKMNIEQQKQ